MNISAIDKKTLVLLGGLLLVCVVLIGIAFSLLKQAPTTVPSTQSTNTQTPSAKQGGFFSNLFSHDLEVASFTPTQEVILTSGKIQTFSVVFNQTITTNRIQSLLTEKIIPTDTSSQIPTTVVLNNAGNGVTITTKSPIKPYATYTFRIREVSSGKTLLSQTYSTTDPTPSPVTTNNPDLQQYLPYVTGTYALSYLPNKNIYVFNFLFNPDDPTDTQTQFENAKQNAILYIKSKGIDPNSVVIDWRFH